MNSLHQEILRTVLYYDIFSYPLTSQEIFLLLPRNSIGKTELDEILRSERDRMFLRSHGGNFFLFERDESIVKLRRQRERRAQNRWIVARLFSHIIKRFPFVRGVFVSGDLAKNVAQSDSDIDYVIVTSPRRLWICRTLLILFKKIFLFNQKKYFCLNYFVTADHLEAGDKNYFTATEIVHLKPLFNFPLFLEFLNANRWIKKFFPNYFLFRNTIPHCSSRLSVLQKILEAPFLGSWVDALDRWLMKKMERIWKHRYPHLTEDEREFRFRCSPTESRAFGQELGSKILALYDEKLARFGLKPPPVL